MTPDLTALADADWRYVTFVAEHGHKRPADYPLPLTDHGVAWWEVNRAAIGSVPRWSDFQSKRDMAALIPVLRANALNKGPSDDE